MAVMEKKSFATPDERRTPPKTELEVVKFGDRVVTRVTYHPGWRWTVDLKPVLGTDLCQVAHLGYITSGRIHCVMQDGTEMDAGTGDVIAIPAGHDAWVIGDEPCVFIDFGGAARPA
jgi:hypothetical protein